MPLIEETLEVIFGEILPDNKQINSIVHAMKIRDYQKQKLNPIVVDSILQHASDHISPRLENLDERQDRFLKLLETFVNEGWNDTATYDSFISGFINNSKKFNDYQATKFVCLLAKAGINRTDLIDSVIKRV